MVIGGEHESGIGINLITSDADALNLSFIQLGPWIEMARGVELEPCAIKAIFNHLALRDALGEVKDLGWPGLSEPRRTRSDNRQRTENSFIFMGIYSFGMVRLMGIFPFLK